VTGSLIWVLPAVLALVDWYAVAREDRRTVVTYHVGQALIVAGVLAAT
jgi:hypothetical protein